MAQRRQYMRTRLLTVGTAGVAAALGIGTAVIPFDLDHPAYQAIVASQFSVVTPGNETKWQAVEPT